MAQRYMTLLQVSHFSKWKLRGKIERHLSRQIPFLLILQDLEGLPTAFNGFGQSD